MNEDLSKYLGLFETEAKQNLQDLGNEFVKLEKDPTNEEVLYNIMRMAHTLKGMSGTMGFKNLSSLCHGMEDFFDRARKKELSVSKNNIDGALKYLDIIDGKIHEAIETKSDPNIDGLLDKSKELLKSTESPTTDSKSQEVPTSPKEPSAKEEIEKITEINVDVKVLDNLVGLLEDLITTKLHFKEIAESQKYENLKYENNKLERVCNDLQYNITQARMTECGYLFNRFPRMIRDIAREAGKEVELEIEGSDIRMDRNIIDELGEPLVHLLRNAVSHGIKEKGKISIIARREKDSAIIEIKDDGEGINLEKVKVQAAKLGIASQEQLNTLSDQEVINLIFDPRLSTNEGVDDVSGRGVGMSVVKSKLAELNGTIKTKTAKGEGTTFILQLPLSLAIIKALLIRVEDQVYAVPVSAVERSVKFEEADIKKAIDQPIAILDDEDIPLIDLREYFHLDGENSKDKKLTLIVDIGTQRVGLVVDELIREEEIIVKAMPPHMGGEKAFSGVSVLGNGKTILILDIQNLTK